MKKLIILGAANPNVIRTIDTIKKHLNSCLIVYLISYTIITFVVIKKKEIKEM